jgi:hypothetical protein
MEPEITIIPTYTALYLRAIRTLTTVVSHKPPAAPVYLQENYAALYVSPINEKSSFNEGYKFEVRSLTSYVCGNREDAVVGYFKNLQRAIQYCEDAAHVREAKI